MKIQDFKNTLLKACQPSPIEVVSDFVNLQDGKPTIILGPLVEEKDDSTHPFYLSLNIHENTLHNCLMDFGASHNLMPKVVMDELGLEITRSTKISILLIPRKSNALVSSKTL